MENVKLSSEKNIVWLTFLEDGNCIGKLPYFQTNLDERLIPEKMIEIWDRFQDKYKIPLERIVYYLYKDEYKPDVKIFGAAKFWQVLEMLYLLNKCSGLGKFEKFFEPGEQINTIRRIIKKWGTTEEKTKEQIIELDTAILSVISELEIASILTVSFAA